jgi:hypothetical protein
MSRVYPSVACRFRRLKALPPPLIGVRNCPDISSLHPPSHPDPVFPAQSYQFFTQYVTTLRLTWR